MLVDLEFLPSRRTLETVVVFDVLRMSTTACALFAAGLGELVVVAEPAAARARARSEGALLLGEREGRPLPDFDGGNSPVEAEARAGALAGRRAVLCTTNGSAAVEAAAAARHVVLGAIVNAAAVARFLLALGAREVLLSCAGTNGAPSLDDVVGAACVLREIVRRDAAATLSDTSLIALRLLDAHEDPAPLLGQAAHAHHLAEIGFAADVAYAGRLNALDVVPWRHAAAPPAFVVERRRVAEPA